MSRSPLATKIILLLTAIFAGHGILTSVGCGKSQAKPKTGVPQTAALARPQWQAAPIEIPKSIVIQFTNDQDEHAAVGSIWPGDGSPVRFIRFTLTGDTALVTLDDGTCHLLDPKTGNSRKNWTSGNRAKAIAVEPTWDGRRLIFQYEDDSHLYIRDLLEGTLVHTLDESKAKISALAVAADPRLLAVGCADGSLQVWDIETGELLEEGSIPVEGARITAIAFANDCQKLYVASAESENIHILELPDLSPGGEIQRTFGVPVKFAASWSGNWLLVVCHNRLAEMIQLQPIEGFPGTVHGALGSGLLRRGELANCFHLSNSNFSCCYSGGTAFDYYDPYLNPAGSSDRQADEEETTAVALAPDGSVAASAFQNGSVRFYKMPGPIKPVPARTVELGQRLVGLFQAANYEELDELANTCLDQVQPDAARKSPAATLIDWLSHVGGESEENYATHFAKLQKWLDTKPQSRAAHVVMATTIKDYAWFQRGADVAIMTSREGGERFLAELPKADKLLKAADEMGAPSAPICTIWALVKMGLGRPKAELVKLWERGIEQTSNYAPLHRTVAYALLPRWLGDEEDVGMLANRALRELPDDRGLLAYEAMAESFLQNESATGIVSAGFDLDKLEQAAQRVLAVYPEDSGGKNFAAVVACLRRDHASAATRFVMIGSGADQRMWRPYPLLLENFRRWSQGNHVPSDAEFSFLAAWMGLTQVTFAGEGTALITLGVDSWKQIGEWNVTDRKQDRVSSLPPRFAPLFMSDGGRFIACGTVGSDRRIVMLDRSNQNMISWPGATLPSRGRISDDESQYAMFGQRPEIAVYDLNKPTSKPAHLLKLEEPVSWVEFPSRQKVWSVVATDKNGRIRRLSADGKDLISPVQMPRPVLRMKAVPQSSQILACGQAMLALVNVENAQVSTLVDEAPNQGERFNYTALAVSRDGAWAAAARANSQPHKVQQPYDIEIWDLAGRRKLETLAGHEASIHTLSFSADNKRLASGDTLGFVQVWSLNEGKQSRQ